MNKRGIVIAVTLLSGLCGIAAGEQRAVAAEPTWSEVAWPFPMDQWGKGKAFACRNCGSEVTVYIRAKIGFCNCTTGVSDDDELARISDFELFANPLAPQGPGKPISVAWMQGRARAFTVGATPGTTSWRAKQSVLSVGFNERCDAIVATAVVGQERPAQVEQAVLDFLNSKTVLRWAEVTLGL